ncbi:MAG TPA: carboxylating nicotinate-nucleotide diphosphorylase [Candidatus Krumholzibacteriaceae bacterium]|nr:carboxylating nicotinate-nucleotide diphosphorylase [Candidatus Krumholzibacteriaceae bacterium]
MKKGILIDLIRAAFDEDDVNNDITTAIFVDSDTSGSAEIIAKREGVISGQECSESVFSFVDDSLIYSPGVEDGVRVQKGDIVAVVEGTVSSILSAERLALNFLGHLSGVATETASFSQKVRGSGIRILDTRKTTPGMRFVEKKAVRDGGGENHRSNLSEMVLVKENHIAIAGGLANILDLLGEERLKKAEIEVGSLDELSLLLKNPPARIMLDNFTPDMVERAVGEVEKCCGERPEIEVSGGISLDTIDDYLIPGVNYISVGSITSSAPALDLSLIIGETVV